LKVNAANIYPQIPF